MFKTLITVPDMVPFSSISLGECLFINDKPYVKGPDVCVGLGHSGTMEVGSNVMVTRAVCSGSIRPGTVRIQEFKVCKKEACKSVEQENTVRIVGIGTLSNDSECVLSGDWATGYIEVDFQQLPCNLNLLGSGPIGSYVTVPDEYIEKLKTLKNKG